MTMTARLQRSVRTATLQVILIDTLRVPPADRAETALLLRDHLEAPHLWYKNLNDANLDVANLAEATVDDAYVGHVSLDGAALTVPKLRGCLPARCQSAGRY